MEDIDRKKIPQVGVFSSISYVCVDEKGHLIDQDVGVALDINRSGLFLETGHQLNTSLIFLMFVDLENNLAELEGEIVYSRPFDSDLNLTGIHFRGSHRQNIEFAQKLIRAYRYRKSELVLIFGTHT